MSNTSMNNQTDLDWLARNVHVWPDGAAFVRIHTNGNEPVFVTESGAACGGHVFTLDQWLARRAGLQNKPGWHEWPQRKFMAQNKNGHWIVSDRDLYPGDDGRWHYDKSQDGGVTSRGIGEVLGDWRDTLEWRPKDLSEPAVTARLKEATDNVLASAPELMSDKFKFETLTSIEDNQEQVMAQHEKVKQQDNSWFDLGELPPIGEFVDVEGEDLVYGDGELNCEVLAHVEDTAVIRMSYGLGCFQGRVLSPSRTEREKSIEEIVDAICLGGLLSKGGTESWKAAARVYDAGYRKDPK